MKTLMSDATVTGRTPWGWTRRARRTILSLAVAAIAFVASPSTVRAQSCGSDLNGDGIVDTIDLAILIGDWGTTAAPTILSISPSGGSTTDGTVITITGTSLCATSSVMVGGVACSNVTVLSGTQVQATTPRESRCCWFRRAPSAWAAPRRICMNAWPTRTPFMLSRSRTPTPSVAADSDFGIRVARNP